MESQTDSPLTELSTNGITDKFLKYHKARGFQIVPGSSLLDPSVPMSFVMSAGLAQVETSARKFDGCASDRYVLAQKCFRYFDLEMIGNSATHLSLFTMPGAFAFGPVSKQAVIAQIWDLLTGEYHFSPDALWVTYFAGGEVSGHRFGPDEASREAWLSVGVPTSHIVGLGPSHNFWKQGSSVVGDRDAPKCGANTEVFFDCGVDFACGPECQPGCQCGRFVEFLNTLFITQHVNEDTGVVSALENPFTELVIGAERVAMLLQRKSSVFEIDAIRPLVNHIILAMNPAHLFAGEAYRQACIIADHVRALIFLVADGAPVPGKGGRRRLMRKLVRELVTGQILLRISSASFLSSLIDLIMDLYGPRNSQLLSARSKTLSYIDEEKKRFERTLRAGAKRLDQLLASRDEAVLEGREVLELEKHHGLPVSLVEAMLRQRQASYRRDAYQTAHKNWYHNITQTQL